MSDNSGGTDSGLEQRKDLIYLLSTKKLLLTILRTWIEM
jgi:hypothetical protein